MMRGVDMDSDIFAGVVLSSDSRFDGLRVVGL